MKELTALEYFKIKNYVTKDCKVHCGECPFGMDNNGYRVTCERLQKTFPEIAINIALKCLAENPDIIKEEKAIFSNGYITRKSILENAEKCVCGDREQDYGSPEDNFKTIAELWTTYVKKKCVGGNTDVCILAEDVAVMMTLLKIARIAGGNFKEDSWVDAIGYLACGGEIAGKTEEK